MENSIYLEHCLIESGYLSELWAAIDIMAKKEKYREQNKTLDYSLEDQAQDEFKHARILKDALKAEGHTPRPGNTVYQYAMQEVIYRNFAGVHLDQTNSFEEFLFMQETMEHRAVWIYKTYLKGGTINRYKDVINIIVEEEMPHLRGVQCDTDFARNVVAIDRHLFRNVLRKRYNNMNLLECPEFWEHYYGDGLKGENESN